MRSIVKKINIQFALLCELGLDEQQLLNLALRVRLNAQAPYSNYFVGAAVLSEKNNIYTGCNVECCNLTGTTHAEQNAIDSMIAAEGPTKIKVITIAAAHKNTNLIILKPPKRISGLLLLEKALAPCGHCLQRIWENCNNDPNVKILSLGPKGYITIATIGDTLPIRFGPKDIQFNK